MRLKEGIVVDEDGTFGTLKFSDLRREVYKKDEEGKATKEVKERTYDLKSKAQGMMIQVSIPAEAGPKDLDYNTEVEIINPVLSTVTNATFRGADVSWYVKADDIVAKKKNPDQQPGQPVRDQKEKGLHPDGQKK